MTLNLAHWQAIGNQLGWKPQYRDPAWTTDHEPRTRGYIDYYIIHHAATTSESGTVDAMQPGGRTVSAQWVLCTDGKFRPVVPIERRAWTSASWLDDIATTVETVNTSGDPDWGINDLQKMAHALNAVDLYRTGKLQSLTRAHIIGHNEVLGISGSGYATACPGPSMQLDLIVELANAIYSGLLGPGVNTTPIGRKEMRLVWAESTGYLQTEDGFHGLPNPATYNLFYRLINSNQANSPFVNGKTPDNFTKAEINAMNGQLTLLRVGNGAQLTPVDAAALAKAVSDATIAAIEAQLGELDVTVDVDYAKIAAEVEAALVDEFAAIPDAVVAEIAD